MWIPKGSEILHLYASRRSAPGTIPEMRLDLLGLRLHRCNQLEIVKGGSILGHVTPKIDHRLTLPFNRIKHLL